MFEVCSRCGLPNKEMLGTHCILCYVDRRAKEISTMPHKFFPIFRKVWFQAHKDEFVDKLKVRVMALKHGLEVGDIEDFVKIFDRSGRRLFRNDKNHTGLSSNGIRAIVRSADRLVKEGGWKSRKPLTL